MPPKNDYLELWNWDGTLERIHHALYVAQREEEGREASPTVAIIDSQSARKRHILVDTLGLLLNVVLIPADIQDTLLDLRCSLNGGSSNEHSRGSVVTVAWLATSNATQRPLPHSSASP